MARINAETKQLNREKLLLAAADEFAREGVAGANINRISLAAGLAKGTVYNYFDSKDALFLEVVREACSRAAVEAEIDDADDTRTALRRLIETDVSWVKKNQAFAQVVIRETFGTDEERYRAVVEASAPFISRTTELLERGQDRGEVRSDLQAIQLALALGGLIELAYLQHWGSGGQWPLLDDIPTLTLQLFLDGASPRQPHPDQGS